MAAPVPIARQLQQCALKRAAPPKDRKRDMGSYSLVRVLWWYISKRPIRIEKGRSRNMPQPLIGYI
ncbi:MAG: hypothetical protein C0605_09885 [Hyphomicrobiales bacterium]|nr:MAG: hypothetical protein C0605_09885 [Hyphomicrobiales bacterium]